MLRVGAGIQGRSSYEGELETASAWKGESKMCFSLKKVNSQNLWPRIDLVIYE